MKKIEWPKRKKKETQLDKEINAILAELENCQVGTSEYEELLDALERLTDIRVKEKPDKEVKRLDPNTILLVLASVGEFVLLLGFDELMPRVLNKTALGQILKLRF